MKRRKFLQQAGAATPLRQGSVTGWLLEPPRHVSGHEAAPTSMPPQWAERESTCRRQAGTLGSV